MNFTRLFSVRKHTSLATPPSGMPSNRICPTVTWYLCSDAQMHNFGSAQSIDSENVDLRTLAD